MRIKIEKKQLFILLFLLCIIYIPRLLNIDAFLNPDGAGVWFNRSIDFYAGLFHLQDYDFRDTLQSGHPGVPLMILSGASIILGSLIEYGDVNVFEHMPGLFFYAKLPIALITGLCIIFVYSYLKKHYNLKSFPFLAAIFIAVDPFFLAHSRYFQLDSLAASFMLLALLTSAVYCQNGKAVNIILSGLFTGLALLTKSYALSLIPFIFTAILFQKYWCKERSQEFKPYKGLVTWTLITALTFIIIWPSMWVQPVNTIKRIAGGASLAITHTHENTGSLQENIPGVTNNSFEQGIQFKPDLFVDFVNKSSSVILIFGLISLSLIAYKIYRRKVDKQTELVAYVSGFFFFFLIGMSFSGKANMRYCVISFIVFDIMAAYGFVNALYWLRKVILNQKWKQFIPGLLVILLLLHVFRVFNFHPYYQAFQNEIYRAQPMVWGEGLEKVAEYLNTVPDSENLTVASFYPPVLRQFYRGNVIGLKSAEAAAPDYYVLYISQVERYLYPELVKKYYLNPDQKPEFIALIKNYEYAWLYRNQDKALVDAIQKNLPTKAK